MITAECKKTFTEIMQELGERWRKMTDEER
jgi:hypothetical protein